jgi:hypothetical protein
MYLYMYIYIYIYIYSEGGVAPQEQVHLPTTGKDKICICVRKRPISAKEIKKNDYDSVTCIHPQGNIHKLIHTYVYTRIYVCIYLCVYVYIHIYFSIYVCIYMFKRKSVYLYIYIIITNYISLYTNGSYCS